jgi:phage recombination protein Bet
MTTDLISSNWTPEQMKLITDVVAKGATPDELKLFLHRCKAFGLDPLKPGQIYFIKYGSGPGTIVIGIEGFRSKAARTGKLSGIKRGVIKEDGKLVGAWAEVYRSDWKECAREEVALSEYTTGRGTWLKMPETMIKKVAECAALRMAFPDDLGGLYGEEEMQQAAPAVTVYPEQPDEGDGLSDFGGYRIPFGKFKARSLEEVGAGQLHHYVEYLEGKAAKDGKAIQGQVKEFIERASEFIGAFENQEIEKNNPEILKKWDDWAEETVKK